MQNMPEDFNVYYQRKMPVTRDLLQNMSFVYFWMVLGLVVTGLSAWFVNAHPDFQETIMTNVVFFSLLIAQLSLVFIFSRTCNNCNFPLAFLMFITITALTGISLSTIFLVFKLPSIVTILMSTAFAFFGLTIFGFLTKYDLGPIGTFCFSGLIGLVGLLILSLFIPDLRTDMASVAYGVLGVLIFSGLTAFDVQKIQKNLAQEPQSSTRSLKGALTLYLDFINLFLSLLRIFGKRK